MIVVITGLPGAGKTLYALNWVKTRAEKEGRQVYYSGIADLALPWIEVDPQRWMDVPANALVVIDECQRVFRPRMHGTSVPPYVSELETHRHKGIDIVLITQHPMLIDSNVRRLAGLHFHCVRKFGMNASTVHEWASVKESCDKNRDGSTRHDFKFPKASFAWYKSAEVHTHKARIPARVLVLVGVLLGLVLLSWRIYGRWHDRAPSSADTAAPAASAAGGSGILPSLVPAPASSSAQSPLTREQWLKAQQPRVEGLAYTAPVYDAVTQPVRAPYPAACIQSASKGCRCYSQQGTRLSVPDDLCRSISDGGFFMAWDDGAVSVPQSGQAQAVQPRRALPHAGPAPALSGSDASGAPVLSGLHASSLSPGYKPRDPVRADEPGGLATIGANVSRASSADGEMLAWMRGR